MPSNIFEPSNKTTYEVKILTHVLHALTLASGDSSFTVFPLDSQQKRPNSCTHWMV